ncbi:MAG: radical SAM protein [Planctomycetia bacterium]|nr:radical SAM protein [Planctomycetia bacterium]
MQNELVYLGAPPRTGTPITSVDLDVTVDCNMRCVYCFKEKRHEQMSDRVAFDAILWLIYSSGECKNLNVALIGGEPLLRFDLIKKLVPFAKRRAAYHGKTIHFSATTNNTLVSDEIINFWRQWGMGFHCSIDGIPEIQNKNRPLVGGLPSSDLVERGVAKILAYRANVCARCTIVPDNVQYIEENYKYFRSLGFVDIAMVPGNPLEWNDTSLAALDAGFRKVGEIFKQEIRAGKKIRVKSLSETMEALAGKRSRSLVMCGAGRGMALIDVHGDIWPCHRWNKVSHGSWRIGSIYDNFSEEARRKLDVRSQIVKLTRNCQNCSSQFLCSGGCPAENLESSGDVFTPAENSCRIIRILTAIGQDIHRELYQEQNEEFLKMFYPPSEEAK